MNSLILAKGLAASSAGSGTPTAGARQFTVADATPFLSGVPAFVVEDDTGRAECLGRVAAVLPGNVLATAWALRLPPTGAWTLRQPAHAVIVPPHAVPLLHRELRAGTDDLTTEGGEHLWAAPREAEELLRVRIQRPDARLLEELLAWGRLIAAAAVPEFALVTLSRATVHAAMAQPAIEVRPELCRAGEPFDLMVRLVATDRLYL